MPDPFRFDGCPGLPDRLLGVELWPLRAEHAGMDLRWWRSTGQQRPRKGPSYVDGGPWLDKLCIDFALGAGIFGAGLEAVPGPPGLYPIVVLPWALGWLALAILAFLGVSALGPSRAPPLYRLWGGEDYRWGRVDPVVRGQ